MGWTMDYWKTVNVAIFVLALCFPTMGAAQIVNVLQQGRVAEDGWAGRLSLSATWKAGNTEVIDTSVGLGASYRAASHLVFVVARGRRGLQGDKTFIAQTFEHLRYRYTLTDLISVESFVQHEFDEFRRINLRLLGGLGGRLSLHFGDNFSAALGLAYMLERELYRDVGRVGGPDGQTNQRGSSYLNLRWTPSKNMIFNNTVFVQPRLDNFRDVRLMNEASVTVKGLSWFGLRLAFRLDYDSRPPAEVETLDTSLETTLVFTLPNGD